MRLRRIRFPLGSPKYDREPSKEGLSIFTLKSVTLSKQECYIFMGVPIDKRDQDMNRRFIFIVIVCLNSLIICTCNSTKLAHYQAKTPEEREVRDFLIQCDHALQYKKMDAYGNCFHENALIQVFGADPGEVTLVGKETFTELFLDRNMGPTSGQHIVNPIISVQKNYAQMQYLEKEGGHPEDVTVSFEMIKENNRWYVIRYRWHYPRKIPKRPVESNR